ncbi:hypothetical protein [Parerythrobacter aestuarii]|uniref:hypothetical protein n=1 Tax=Parerythrobacter aestuarii TaxID=3020909 RepID=UPI0024DE57D1|nr:hypothetical protein [Parerythrobacter aestuarii]
MKLLGPLEIASCRTPLAHHCAAVHYPAFAVVDRSQAITSIAIAVVGVTDEERPRRSRRIVVIAMPAADRLRVADITFTGSPGPRPHTSVIEAIVRRSISDDIGYERCEREPGVLIAIGGVFVIVRLIPVIGDIIVIVLLRLVRAIIVVVTGIIPFRAIVAIVKRRLGRLVIGVRVAAVIPTGSIGIRARVPDFHWQGCRQWRRSS